MVSERERARRSRFRIFISEYYAARQADLEAEEAYTGLYATEVAEYRAVHGPPMYLRLWLIQSRGLPR